MVWAIEFRPAKLDDFVGNKDVVARIKKFLQLRSFPKTSIFCGESGTGKTTLAYIVASELDLEVYEYNVANMRGIDTIREVIDLCSYTTLTGKGRLFIFDEAHRFTRDAQEAMLKLLESKDGCNYFILCTTDVFKLIPTIRNRAKVFMLRCLTFEECQELALKLRKHFQLAFSWDVEVLKEVWLACHGIPRLIVNVLEEVRTVEDLKRVQLHVLFDGFSDDFLYIARKLVNRELTLQDLRILSCKGQDEIVQYTRRLKKYVLELLLSCKNEEENKWSWYMYILDRLSKVKEEDETSLMLALCRIVLEGGG